MAFLEGIAAGAEALEGAETVGAGAEAATAAETAGATEAGAPTTVRDSNDSPVGKILGSRFGRAVTADVAAHEIMKPFTSVAGQASNAAFGDQGYTHENIGAMGNV